MSAALNLKQSVCSRSVPSIYFAAPRLGNNFMHSALVQGSKCTFIVASCCASLWCGALGVQA